MLQFSEETVHQTAASLTVNLLENFSGPGQAEYKNILRAAIFPRFVHFLQRDVACGLDATLILYKDILKDSWLSNTPTSLFINSNSSLSISSESPLFQQLFQHLCFDTYHPGAALSPETTVDATLGELERCVNTFLANEAYTPESLANDLTGEADGINSEVLFMFWSNLEEMSATNLLFYLSKHNVVNELEAVLSQVAVVQNSLLVNGLSMERVVSQRAETENKIAQRKTAP